MKNKWVVIAAIACIAWIETVALQMGYNGTILKLVIAVIAGLAGFMIPSPFQKDK